MKKVVYLHGLESKQNCLKVHYLRDIGFEVLNPKMDYKDPNCFIDTQYKIQEFKPDLIIGSSMGGYFAWFMGKYFETPVILLNPALHSRSFEPVIDNWGCELASKVYLITDKDDDVIDPSQTVKWLNENDKWDLNPNNHIVGKHGHRTPVSILITFFSYFPSLFPTEYVE